MKPKAWGWLVGGLAAGGCAFAIAHSPQTNIQPIFQPQPTGVPIQQGGSDQGPSQNLGVPNSEIPPAQTQSTQAAVNVPSPQSSTSKLATKSSPAGLSGFAACWWKYYHGERSKPC